LLGCPMRKVEGAQQKAAPQLSLRSRCQDVCSVLPRKEGGLKHVQDFLNRLQAADSVLDCVGFLRRSRWLRL
ncbi:MAG TPA: hypothetical protein PK971_07265, partial [Saprospiraceae bacterium]|nr:hypothetical protein [Saprospiraceae bacterium]